MAIIGRISSVAFCVGMCLFLNTTPLSAEVITIDVTIKAIDAKERSLTVTKVSKSVGKDLDLEIGKSAKVRIDGREAPLDVLKPGQKASISYESNLEVVTKVEIVGEKNFVPTPPRPLANVTESKKDPEIRNVAELNSSGMEGAPWFSNDGLTVYWTADGPNSGESFVFTAKRKTPEASFTDKKMLFPGVSPVVTDDGLEIIFRAVLSNAFLVATRKTHDEPFGKTHRIPDLELSGQVPLPSSLSRDGLTLYLDMDHDAWVTTRPKRNGQWQTPKRMNLVKDEITTARFSGAYPTAEGTRVYCSASLPDDKGKLQGGQLVILSRRGEEGPFTDFTPIRIKSPTETTTGFSPRYVEATRELFFISDAPLSNTSPSHSTKRSLWVVKNFVPPSTGDDSGPRSFNGDFAKPSFEQETIRPPFGRASGPPFGRRVNR